MTAARLRAPTRQRSRLIAPTHLVARDRRTRELWVLAFRGDVLVGAAGPLEDPVPPAFLLPYFDFASPAARRDLAAVRPRIRDMARVG